MKYLVMIPALILVLIISGCTQDEFIFGEISISMNASWILLTSGNACNVSDSLYPYTGGIGIGILEINASKKRIEDSQDVIFFLACESTVNDEERADFGIIPHLSEGHVMEIRKHFPGQMPSHKFEEDVTTDKTVEVCCSYCQQYDFACVITAEYEQYKKCQTFELETLCVQS